MKKKTIIEIDYNELEDLVREHLGFKKYSFVATEECSNDSSHEFDVDGILDKWDKLELEKWPKGKAPQYSNRVILNALCEAGHIEAGEYLVTVCW
jgi:hypothetical protein